ncbi:MAG: hypothetical protein GC160_11450 [Acidobacteria bacterium]|nr:hypothetical protein [Acidobacteriota bacterium]
MTLNEKIAQIVRNLKHKTASGEATWDTMIDDGFITSRPDSSIVIEKTRRTRPEGSRKNAPLPPNVFRLILSDSKGMEVAALDDSDLPDPTDLIELYEQVAKSKAEVLADAWLR